LEDENWLYLIINMVVTSIGLMELKCIKGFEGRTTGVKAEKIFIIVFLIYDT